MKVCDIIMEGSDLQPVAQTIDGTWYQITYDQAVKGFAKTHTQIGGSLNDFKNHKLFMWVDKDGEPWAPFPELVALDNQNLESVVSQLKLGFSDLHGVLDALVKVTHAQTSKGLSWDNWIVYQGKTYNNQVFYTIFPQVATLQGSAVHEIPQDAWWVFVQAKQIADISSQITRLFAFAPPGPYKTWRCIYATANKTRIVTLHTYAAVPNTILKQYKQVLSQKLGLAPIKMQPHLIKPNSVAHQMLKLINDNPGIRLNSVNAQVYNTPFYSTVEGAESDVEGKLHMWNLITLSRGVLWHNSSCTITTTGKLVLARLNSDQAVNTNTLIK